MVGDFFATSFFLVKLETPINRIYYCPLWTNFTSHRFPVLCWNSCCSLLNCIQSFFAGSLSSCSLTRYSDISSSLDNGKAHSTASANISTIGLFGPRSLNGISFDSTVGNLPILSVPYPTVTWCLVKKSTKKCLWSSPCGKILHQMWIISFSPSDSKSTHKLPERLFLLQISANIAVVPRHHNI